MNLPDIEYYEKRKASWYSALCHHSRDECADRLTELLTGDSWAVVVNGNVLFNRYENKDLRETLIDTIIRDKITDQPFCMLNDLLGKSKNGRIDIYLGGETPWFAVCYYNHDNGMLVIEYYKSQKYIEYQKRIL
jgi:hypothetical protein